MDIYITSRFGDLLELLPNHPRQPWYLVVLSHIPKVKFIITCNIIDNVKLATTVVRNWIELVEHVSGRVSLSYVLVSFWTFLGLKGSIYSTLVAT